MNSANPIIAILSLLGISFSLLAEDFPLALQSTFKAHCIKCHGKGGKVKGKVNLLELKSVDDLLAKPELLETLLTVLKDREMPPKDEAMVPAGTIASSLGGISRSFRTVSNVSSNSGLARRSSTDFSSSRLTLPLTLPPLP